MLDRGGTLSRIGKSPHSSETLASPLWHALAVGRVRSVGRIFVHLVDRSIEESDGRDDRAEHIRALPLVYLGRKVFQFLSLGCHRREMARGVQEIPREVGTHFDSHGASLTCPRGSSGRCPITAPHAWILYPLEPDPRPALQLALAERYAVATAGLPVHSGRDSRSTARRATQIVDAFRFGPTPY